MSRRHIDLTAIVFMALLGLGGLWVAPVAAEASCPNIGLINTGCYNMGNSNSGNGNGNGNGNGQ